MPPPFPLLLLMMFLQENLKLTPAMLSRFDLIFVLLDRPDELMDQALSEHIMALHSGKPRAACIQALGLAQHHPRHQRIRHHGVGTITHSMSMSAQALLICMLHAGALLALAEPHS
jgi:hypothetical protein